jgi:aquaporin Z
MANGAGRPPTASQLRAHELSRGILRSLLAADAPWVRDFNERRYEWRRVFAELFGTFFLVVVAAGAPTVSAAFGEAIGRGAAVTAPALMVMALILATGAVSGAHLNPVVTVGFALRGDFPWRRVPAYVLAQGAGAVLAALCLIAIVGHGGGLGATRPGPGVGAWRATAMEALLTLGLVTTILGTASGAQNVGSLSAIAVAGYIALAGLWASPLTGASMNPARSFGPALVSGDLRQFWVYLLGPTIGMACAVGAAWILRGRGGDEPARRAAQGALGTLVVERRDLVQRDDR